MIPIDYLKVEKRGKTVKPKYLKTTAPAAAVLEAAQKAKTLGQFREAVAALPIEKKLAEALAHLAQRHMQLEEVDPRKVARVRIEVFKISTQLGPPLTEEEREEIFIAAAARLGMAPQEVKTLFQKAYPESRQILAPPRLDPQSLVEQYNQAAIQALLYKSLYVKAKVPNSPQLVKKLVRAVKGLRLMYTAEEAPGGLELHLDGPVSAIKQTERYGLRLAKLVPYITTADKWEIEAEVKIGEKIYTFKETSATAPPLPRHPPPEDQEFDSTIEQEFYRQVSRICHVEREPEVVVVDRRVYIPDFKIGDLLIEIVGFWTPDYIKRKYEKLRRVGRPILILLSEELALSTWKEPPPNTVIFKDRPRLSDVYKYIKPHCVNSSRQEATHSQ